ncbi:MAG: UDP-N-acetylmuramoyl-L-alanine--D-glutamate ligase [Eubacterium sp.]|jgi:UDP-N-acetylmuramoylalanine--D-glutamate ligase|nr:UDP-N-acetylmuramoyl-L-alanine--D-glutamate ligase [Eubacterium sp.]
MVLKDKKVLVVGLGKSGMAAYELLRQIGADVSLYDGNPDVEVGEIDVPVYRETYPEGEFALLDCAVFSPGVPLDIPLAAFLKNSGVPVIGEIELAYQMEQGRVIGITGTNGKTTTTTLVGEIMNAYYENTFVVGNIGNPYTLEASKTSPDSVTVAEISSFQLETIDTFAPDVSAVLNITPDHLNRHKTMENYIDTKMNITKNQGGDKLCVLNYEDEVLRERAAVLPCRVAFFSSRRKPVPVMPPDGQPCLDLYQTEEGDIVCAESGRVLLNQSQTRLPGSHNAENIMAALIIAREMGVPEELAIRTVRKFRPVEHRVEFVETVSGVDYYNDSKGTNPDAAIKGIQSMDRPTVLIGGGYDKGGDFSDWIRSFDGKVKKLLLLGETKHRIAKEAEECGFSQYEIVETLEEAVAAAHELAAEGDAVLLSPACASWDMFQSYEQRGDRFKELVRELK